MSPAPEGGAFIYAVGFEPAETLIAFSRVLRV